MPFLITIAEDVSGEALARILDLAAIGERCRTLLEDIAIVTGETTFC
jgi:hypothetical protein